MNCVLLLLGLKRKKMNNELAGVDVYMMMCCELVAIGGEATIVLADTAVECMLGASHASCGRLSASRHARAILGCCDRRGVLMARRRT